MVIVNVVQIDVEAVGRFRNALIPIVFPPLANTITTQGRAVRGSSLTMQSSKWHSPYHPYVVDMALPWTAS